jgi:hypothetical protein
MNAHRLAVLCLCACATPSSTTKTEAPPAPAPAATSAPAPKPEPVKAEVLGADTPKSTTEGNPFIAPAGWSFRQQGALTVLEAPETDSRIVLADVKAADADAAVAAAWAAYKPDHKWPLLVTTPTPDKDGWANIKGYTYETSPNERRVVRAQTLGANGGWTVVIYDMAEAVGEKRMAQVGLIFGKLFPKGYTRESFAGKKANPLDAARLAELSKFVETARTELGVPGVAVGIVQDGKVVFADGFGSKELNGKAKPDGDTLFMIASNTKALTTLMLAKLVDQKKASWTRR